MKSSSLKAIRHCEKKEYKIFREYVEPGESACADDQNREKFHEMVADGKAGKFDAALVHRFNRFYRDQYRSMFYKKILREHNV